MIMSLDFEAMNLQTLNIGLIWPRPGYGIATSSFSIFSSSRNFRSSSIRNCNSFLRLSLLLRRIPPPAASEFVHFSSPTTSASFLAISTASAKFNVPIQHFNFFLVHPMMLDCVLDQILGQTISRIGFFAKLTTLKDLYGELQGLNKQEIAYRFGKEKIEPQLLAGKNVMIAAHGKSLRFTK
ncbi:hypothetical protein COLO4_07338 [Corchorus olitorius]|uniref:Uncharacterized protein n=1 Tax=Corchorus olitorius TaxID=93759 RepID=A0A1R3KK66_9ROSI|nr:hypothetical protein COLO4_07338 [Corchorus olitorius]